MLVSDAIAYSLRVAGVLGVGQVALSQDTADALIALRMMLRQWQRKRWLVWRLQELTIPLVPGKGIYTIGPGGGPSTAVETWDSTAVTWDDTATTWDVAPGATADAPYVYRPGNIEAAYLRQLVSSSPSSYPVDYRLARVGSREEWADLALKQLQSWPSAFFYDPTVPDGTLYVWPVPIQDLFEVHVFFPQDLGGVIEPATDLDYLPPETAEALTYNLALRLRLNYRLPTDPGLAAAARAALNTLRMANYAVRPLEMPAALRGAGRIKNPMGGFYPEVAAGVPYTVLG
jgi:hypothetical protein